MAYKRGLKRGMCAIVVHEFCNSVDNAGGGGAMKNDGFVHKSFKVNEYLVKAKLDHNPMRILIIVLLPCAVFPLVIAVVVAAVVEIVVQY